MKTAEVGTTARVRHQRSERWRWLGIPLTAALPSGSILGALVGAGVWMNLTTQGLGEVGVGPLMLTFAGVGALVALVAATGSVFAVLAARARGTGDTARIAIGAGVAVGVAVVLTALLGAASTWWTTAAWVAVSGAVLSGAAAASITKLTRRLLHL